MTKQDIIKELPANEPQPQLPKRKTKKAMGAYMFACGRYAGFGNCLHYTIYTLSKITMPEMATEYIDIEAVCEKVHKAYCKYHLENKGIEYWTKGDYSKLTEEGKEYDRRTVKAVLEALKIPKPEGKEALKVTKE